MKIAIQIKFISIIIIIIIIKSIQTEGNCKYVGFCFQLQTHTHLVLLWVFIEGLCGFNSK